MSLITSNRAYPSELRDPIAMFCHDVGIKSLCWIECEGGVRIETEAPDYKYVMQAIDVIETTSAAIEREHRRHEAALERFGSAEANDLNAIKRRRAAQRKATAPVLAYGYRF